MTKQPLAGIDAALLRLLACPRTRRPLRLDAQGARLVEPIEGFGYEVRDETPILLDPSSGGRESDGMAGSFPHSYDEVLRSPQMKALYGASGYFNVGYWEHGPASLRQACDAMVDKLAGGLAADAEVILDVGCGLGAVTARLAALRPAASVVGVNISLWQLLQARDRGVRHRVVCDARQLAFGEAVADGIVACESPQHFDTREDFLCEALRVLKPGGTIALADMLFHDREPVGGWMLPASNRTLTPAHYRDHLRGIGFDGVDVRDVTEVTWIPFCREMKRVLVGGGAQHKRVEESLSHYVIAFARKPGG